MRTLTTLISLVGADTSLVERISASNVSVEATGDVPAEPPARARHVATVWRRAIRRSSVYTVVDSDPLAGVVEAWGRRLTGHGDDLELAIGLTPDAPAPDYYLVDPAIPEPAIHWYGGHLRSLAPARVIVADLRPAVVLETLSSLPYGPGLPDLATLARDARDYVPLPGPAQPLTTPSGLRRATPDASPASSHDSTTTSTSL